MPYQYLVKKGKVVSTGYNWSREIVYLKAMLEMELITLQMIIKNRYQGLLAQDHISNMVALIEVQRNILCVQTLFTDKKNDEQNNPISKDLMDDMMKYLTQGETHNNTLNNTNDLDISDFQPQIDSRKTIEPKDIQRKVLQRYYNGVLKQNKVWMFIIDLFKK